MNPFVSLLGTAALLAAPLHPGDAAKRDRYQKMADGLVWTEPADPPETFPGFQLGRAIDLRLGGGLTVDEIVISDSDQDRRLYSWRELGAAAYRIRGGIIFRADYNSRSTGCAIIAFDLKAGKEVWKATLKGLGPIDHSKYHNRVRMEKVDDTVFAVYGDESAGKYVELVEYATGRTLGHKVFPKD